MWLPLIVVSAIGAFLFMDNLSSARSSFGDQLVIARRQQTWVMSFLYIGTFGSFVGYSAAFPLLLKTQFPAVTASLAFLGPWWVRSRGRSAASSPTRSAGPASRSGT